MRWLLNAYFKLFLFAQCEPETKNVLKELQEKLSSYIDDLGSRFCVR